MGGKLLLIFLGGYPRIVFMFILSITINGLILLIRLGSGSALGANEIYLSLNAIRLFMAFARKFLWENQF